MPRTARNPADQVLRARAREQIRFVDLTERMALKLAAVPEYTARVHFGVWHRFAGKMPDFEHLRGVFTPLVYVELAVEDLRLNPRDPLLVSGESFLARALDAAGDTRHLLREGRHAIRTPEGALVATARLINVFTRYDPDPARRRVTTLPPELGLGTGPTRVAELPALDDLVPASRRPDFAETEAHVWHYGQTDPNRHVNGMEYLRTMEEYVADVLHGRGHDLRRLAFTRTRIVYRKPSFRGEGYRRVAWVQGEAPLTITGAFVKADDPAGRPAAAIELTVAQHNA
jgi:acyl-CoA thioesterase FadM